MSPQTRLFSLIGINTLIGIMSTNTTVVTSYWLGGWSWSWMNLQCVFPFIGGTYGPCFPETKSKHKSATGCRPSQCREPQVPPVSFKEESKFYSPHPQEYKDL